MRRSRRNRWAFWRLAACLPVTLACSPSALADDPIEIGRTIFVANDVEGRMGDAQPKRIVINENVLYEEDIITAEQAETIMEFRDGSTFEVGPGAVVRIDSFVFNPDESVSRKAVSVGRGVFRYISGIASNEQEAQISTPGGMLAIRGSVVAGIVDPEVPTFVYVGEGAATFTNDVGSTSLQPGSAIAVPSRTTPVMPASAMPPAVTAQALQAIARRLPPRDVLRNRPFAGYAALRRAGAANLLPIADQARRQVAPAAGRALPAAAGRSSISNELGLLVEGNRRNLFDGAQTARTAEQDAFINQAAKAAPDAPALIAKTTAQAGGLHKAAQLAGTAVVIRSVAAAAPSSEVLTRVASAAIRANPAAAPIVTRTATAGLRGPARIQVAAQLNKAAVEAARPAEHASTPPTALVNRVAARVPENTPPQRANSDRLREPRSGSTAAAARPPLRQQAAVRAPPSRPPAKTVAPRPPLRQQVVARRPPPRPRAAARAPQKRTVARQPVGDRRNEQR